MTSLPDPSNDYQAPLVMALSRAVWNAVFGSIGARLRALEGTTADYEAAIAQLETQALAVISATITDEITARRADFDQLEAEIALAQDAVAELQAGGVAASAVTLTSIAGLAAVNAQAAIAELLTKIEAEATARGEALANVKAVLYRTYANRGDLRSIDGPADTMALVEGLGLFVWVSGSDQPDDDETAFASASGVWLLEAASWDAAYAYWLPDVDELRTDVDGLIILGTATCSLTSVSTVQGAEFTASISGAQVGDPVIVNPPGPLETSTTGRLTHHAWVSSADTVTIRIVNPSASSGILNAAVTGASNPWRVAVIRGI